MNPKLDDKFTPNTNIEEKNVRERIKKDFGQAKYCNSFKVCITLKNTITPINSELQTTLS